MLDARVFLKGSGCLLLWHSKSQVGMAIRFFISIRVFTTTIITIP